MPSSTAAAISEGSEQSNFRLPPHVRPTHYDLAIQTDLEELTYSGFVRISLDVLEDTNEIVLNAGEGLTAPYPKRLDHEGQSIDASAQAFDAENERLSLIFSPSLAANSTAVLTIRFHAPLTDSLLGYYYSTDNDEAESHSASAEKHYALTQFEPTAARRAFPCFDEPAPKATFALTMVGREGTMSLGNMDVVKEADLSAQDPELAALLARSCSSGKWTITRFATTPPMSTYIVAWANGAFEYRETRVALPVSGKEVPLRIYATKDNIEQTQFALEVMAKVLPLYEQVFDVPYPLPKLDILVASAFDDGAMENWGLITGKESVLLVDPVRADFATKNLVACVVSHEVAHMWFGNIATMRWWDNLYLNEGFATLVGEVIITDKVFPEWKLPSEFIDVYWVDALAMDAKRSSHPIEVECPDANRVNQIFDDLSYSKAAAVLRMLAAHVGEEKFLKGVTLYLKDHLYGNTVSQDLWDGIAKATGQDITAFMTKWVQKIGFPIVTVTEDVNGIKVRQDRFLTSGPAEPEENETTWSVPLAILTEDDGGKSTVDRAVLSEREGSYGIDTSKPFKLNAGTTGVYHVLYTPERLAKIAQEAAKEGSLFTLDDRLGIVHDAFATSKAGLATLSSALDVVNALKDTREYLLWSCIAQHLDELSSVWWEDDGVVNQLKAFARSLFPPIVEELGCTYSDSDSADTTQLRTLAISQAIAGEDPGVVAKVERLFEPFLQSGDESSIPADLLLPFFVHHVKHGGRTEYERAKEMLDNPNAPQDTETAIRAMCATRDPVLLEEVTQYAFHESLDQDVLDFFHGLQENPLVRRSLAGKVKADYDEIYERLEDNFSFDSIITCPFEVLSTEKDYEDTKAFFTGKDISKFDLSLAQALDSIKARHTYIARSTDDLKAWLERWPQTIATSA
ncbi:peptidase family M1-domain-containing protein [Schizophyllum commune]